MFCPRCGSHQSEEQRFCKSCGANLGAVRSAVDRPTTDEKFEWSKTWLAEMFLSESEQKRRKGESEQKPAEKPGKTAEVKRYNEIKAGVITTFIGAALIIVLYVLMQGIILGGKIPDDTAEILSRVWVAGVLPLLIGLGIIINGVFISKRLVEVTKRAQAELPTVEPAEPSPRSLRAGDTTEFITPNFSVTEDTTKHLGSPVPRE